MSPEERFIKAVRELPPNGKNKVPVTIRMDADVVEWFKKQEEKWQSHMNRVLQLYVQIFMFDNRLDR